MMMMMMMMISTPICFSFSPIHGSYYIHVAFCCILFLPFFLYSFSRFFFLIYCSLFVFCCFKFCYVGYYVSSIENMKQTNFVGFFSIVLSLCFISSSFIVLDFCVGIYMVFWNKPNVCSFLRPNMQHWSLFICSLIVCNNEGDKTRFQSN